MIESVEVVIRQPGFPDRVVPLSQGQTCMGRGDDNEIVLSDVGVSRRHAQIVVSDTEVSIEDLGSGNGTYYFGHKVTSQPLRDQDEVVIDPFVLHFRIRGGASAGTNEAPTVAVETQGARIEVVVGNGMVGSLFPIADTGLTMGRAEDRDIVVPDPASSRHHCYISLAQGEYVLHDNGSANGVFVNAVRVRECTLSTGDLVRIGNTEMRFVNPAAQVEQMMAAAIADPIASAPEPAIDFPIDPYPQQHYHQQETSRAPTSRKGGILAAFAGVLIVLLLGGLTALVVILAIVVMLLQMSAAPPPIPTSAPEWSLTGVLPAGDVAKLDKEGRLATNAGKHGEALGYYLQILKQDPGNNTAAKFSTFSGTALVVANLEKQKTASVENREKMERRRDKLLVQYRNRRMRDKANAALNTEFRDDLLVQDKLQWGMTPKQIRSRKDLDKAKDQIELQDRQGEGIRLLRRLLAESTDPETRNQAHLLISKGVEHQADMVADSWRKAVMNHANGDKIQAKNEFKVIMTADTSNVSAALHLKKL